MVIWPGIAITMWLIHTTIIGSPSVDLNILMGLPLITVNSCQLFWNNMLPGSWFGQQPTTGSKWSKSLEICEHYGMYHTPQMLSNVQGMRNSYLWCIYLSMVVVSEYWCYSGEDITTWMECEGLEGLPAEQLSLTQKVPLHKCFGRDMWTA
jgi:hypothetical protein